MLLPESAGAWAGTNGFRLLPQEPFAESAATAELAPATGGHLTRLAHEWRHPDDGPQDGLLVVWAAGADGALAALWGGSWHQQPEPARLTPGPARRGAAGDRLRGRLELADRRGGAHRRGRLSGPSAPRR